MINYNRLWKYLETHGIRQQRLIDGGINRRTIYKLKNNENVNTETLNAICNILECNIFNIIEYFPDDERRARRLIKNSSKYRKHKTNI